MESILLMYICGVSFGIMLLHSNLSKSPKRRVRFVVTGQSPSCELRVVAIVMGGSQDRSHGGTIKGP